MCRARILQTVLCALILQGLNPFPTLAFQRIEIDPTQADVDIDSRDVERPPTQGNDGTYIVTGHFGALPGCPGVQAFITRYESDGDVAWTKSAGAGKDCDDDGQPDGGDPLFENMTSLDPSYIQSSTGHETIYAPDGSSYTTGQFLLAWYDDNEELTVIWAAFVLHHSPEGVLLADLYVGPPLTGYVPAEAQGCSALCAALGDNSETQWGGRELAWVDPEPNIGSGLILAGWVKNSINQGEHDKDVFVAALTPDLTLTTIKWFQAFPYPGSDVPIEIVVADNGDIYATGRYGPDYDFYVVRLSGTDGALTHLFLGGGPHGDWGEEIKLNDDGTIEVIGIFTESATFGDEENPVFLQGEGMTRFSALLTAELELLDIQVIGEEEHGEQAMAPLIPLKSGELPNQDPPPDPGKNMPTNIDIVVGTAITEVTPALVSSVDHQYLMIAGEHQPEHKRVEIIFEVPISPEAPKLTSVDLQFRSQYCTDVNIYLGGGAAATNEFHGIGGTGICPFNESLITVQIPSDIAENELGYTATSQPTEPVLVLIVMEIHGSHIPSICLNTPGLECVSGGEDEELNMTMVNSEEY